MLIAAIQKLTTVDYPGHLACIIFTQGCNFACGYCHNPEMIPTVRVLPYSPELEPENVFKFLARRRLLLDGVVISGGEPSIQADLDDFIARIKELGFLVKLDTNGSNPGVVRKLLDRRLIDFIAMDVKHTFDKYASLVKNDCKEEIAESIELIKGSGIPYEFRSTILPRYHGKDDLIQMGKMVKGAGEWNLQQFRPLKTLSRDLRDERTFSESELLEFKSTVGGNVAQMEIRTST